MTLSAGQSEQDERSRPRLCKDKNGALEIY